MQADDQFLSSAMGLEGLEDEEKQAALEDIYHTINVQLGKRLGDVLDEKKAAEFEEISENGDDEKIAQWLKEHFPNYEQLVIVEGQKLRDEVQLSVKRAMEH